MEVEEALKLLFVCFRNYAFDIIDHEPRMCEVVEVVVEAVRAKSAYVHSSSVEDLSLKSTDDVTIGTN
jgi:hypothetical protein